MAAARRARISSSPQPMTTFVVPGKYRARNGRKYSHPGFRDLDVPVVSNMGSRPPRPQRPATDTVEFARRSSFDDGHRFDADRARVEGKLIGHYRFPLGPRIEVSRRIKRGLSRFPEDRSAAGDGELG